jgi:hypothetical protein
LVTTNTAKFERIRDLRLENWTAPPSPQAVIAADGLPPSAATAASHVIYPPLTWN